MSKIYSIIGTNSMTVVADSINYNPQQDEILMEEERPSISYISNENGEWIIDKQKIIDELDITYNREKTELANYFLEATIMNNEELQTEIKSEIEQLNINYDKERKNLESE